MKVIPSLSSLEQGSQQWHEWRRGGIGASSIAAVLGICPWNTPLDVYNTIKGKNKFEGNSFTRHGSETEAKARARYELISMEDMKPACATHPKYEICRASLDGISADHKKILEIKCPKSRITLDEVLAGKIPEHYRAQTNYQLAVTGADECDFFVYHEESGEHALLKVLPDIDYQGVLIATAINFWEKYVLTDTPPPLTDSDVKIIEDNADIKAICDEILEIHETAKKGTLDNLKAVAIELAGHPKMKCGLVQISTVMRKGKFSFHKLTIGKGEK